MTLKVQEGTILLGKYRVEKELGHGAMGYVVAARHVDLDEPRALKLLLPDALKNADVAERFLREARASARLKSEHATRIHDFGRLDDGSPVMVMEYLVGEDLQCVLDRRKRLPYDEAASYVLQACEAVAEAHELKIVHRDLKPSNLFLTRRPDGTACVKVLDFGISKSLDDATENAPKLTATNTVMGTPYYMSPEQMRNSKATDERGDIWSLGVILYEFVTGHVPFDGDNFVDISSNAVFHQPLPPTEWRPDIPGELERIILRCLEKNPNDRFPSVREFMAALRPLAPVAISLDRASVPAPSDPTSAQAIGDKTTVKQSDPKEGAETLVAAPPAPAAPAPRQSADFELSELPRFYSKSLPGNQAALRAARERRRRAMKMFGLVIAMALLGGAVFYLKNNPKIQAIVALIRARAASSAPAIANSQGAPSPSEATSANAPPSVSVSAPAKSKIATKPAANATSRTTPKSSAAPSSSVAAPSSSAAAPSSSAAAPSASAKAVSSSSVAAPSPKDGGK